MYESVEVEGNTVEEAIKKAMRQLKAKRSEIEIKIVSEETRGLFGMPGAKPAKVRVTLIAKK